MQCPQSEKPEQRDAHSAPAEASVICFGAFCFLCEGSTSICRFGLNALRGDWFSEGPSSQGREALLPVAPYTISALAYLHIELLFLGMPFVSRRKGSPSQFPLIQFSALATKQVTKSASPPGACRVMQQELYWIPPFCILWQWWHPTFVRALLAQTSCTFS